MSTAGYVYATQMPTGLIKVGMGRNAKRAEAGKTFGPIEVLKIWTVTDRWAAEKLAHEVLDHLRVGKHELFKGDGKLIVALIDSVLEMDAKERQDIQDAKNYVEKRDYAASLTAPRDYYAVEAAITAKRRQGSGIATEEMHAERVASAQGWGDGRRRRPSALRGARGWLL
jgi:hypothetical protein